MLSWMLYSIVVSLLMGLAALALERSAQIRQRPARWLWGTCMVASLAILFIPSKVSVQIPETTHADRATSSEILTPRKRQQSKRRGSRCRSLAPIKPRYLIECPRCWTGPGVWLPWLSPWLSSPVAPIVVETTSLGPRSYGRDRRLHIGGFPVPPLSGFYVHILSCRVG